MDKELKKRSLTGIFLFAITIFLILVNKVIFIIALFVVAFISFTEWININVNISRKNKFMWYFIKVSGLLYLFICFIPATILLRGESYESAIFLILILCICICSDIGGYVFGKTFGGVKLTKISPAKTLSGSIGSFIFSILPIFLLNFQDYIDIYFFISSKNIFFSLIISLSCQLGDLFISYFKRLNKVKDSGNILPGHGGLLDRIDGIIFALPIAYILRASLIF